MACCGYLGVLCLIPLILNQDDSYIDFHARQGLVLWIWGVLSVFALHLPVLGPYLFSTSTVLIALLALFGIVSVLFNKAWRIPVIADLSDRFR
ncbi:MAG: hypothetical protein HQL58_01105 [Magnetococcales bacterium]|nr:hypothetical protein [Magnetococcales bacterium]